ncbi:hypothetical protein IWW42_005247 [Coemansia sp. RSA 1085]|nr:hypothetical protein IWW42_005247 [Coemansia sp. RSA 1085]
MNPIAVQLRTLLTSVLQSDEAQSCDSILLSGGLDTSIAAEIINEQQESQLNAGITVTIDPSSNQLANKHNLFIKQPQDIEYATRIANKLGISHHVLTPTLDELVNGPAMDLCTKTLRTFESMELRNAMVIAHALLYAKSLGLSRVCTGDGADELFAGYKFMHQMDKNKLCSYIREMAKTMRFCAIPLAKSLGIAVWSPYLDGRVIEFATSNSEIPASLLIGEFSGAVHGKLILRQAFPGVVAAARGKEPIECGSGTAVMPALAEHLIADDEFAERTREIKLRFDIDVGDKERLLYFPSFQRMVLEDLQIMNMMGRYGANACPDLLSIKLLLEEITLVDKECQKLLGLVKGRLPDNHETLESLGIISNTRIRLIGTRKADQLRSTKSKWDEPDCHLPAISDTDSTDTGTPLLVLDLDYTLLDCNPGSGDMVNMARPGLDQFLTAAYRHYDLIVWSQTSWMVLESKMTILGMLTHPNYRIVSALNSSMMISVRSQRGGKVVSHHVKALEIIWSWFSQYNYKNTVHVDDLDRNFVLNWQRLGIVVQGKVVFKRPMGRKTLEHLGRVIGGTDAGSGSYPFAAFLMVDEGDSTAFCGGSIISPEWILTAGHCVVDTRGGNKLHINGTETPHQLAQKLQTKWPANWGKSQRQFKTVGPKDIVVGVGSIYNVQTEPQKVSKVVVHPDLDLDYFDNDIALLKLKHKLKFNSHVQPIHIDTDVVSDGLTVTGIGWGKTSLESQTTANVLQQVDLQTGDEGLCRRIRPEFDDNDGNYICVTTPEGRDTCSGDSGGPLLRRCNGDPRLTGSLGNGPWVLLGITSYGDSVASSSETVCAAQDGAGFYTHAAKYLGFISDTTGIKKENLAASCNGSKINYVGNINAAKHASIFGALQLGAILVAIFQFI